MKVKHDTTAPPLVTVIIPTRNRAALLREAVASVLAVPRVGFELEVIVVDDGSDAETREVAAANPVMYLRTDGIGVSAARNRGIEAAHGEYLAFIDDDDLWLSHNVSTQLQVLIEYPDYGAVVAQVQLTDANRKPYGEPLPRPPIKANNAFEYFLGAHAQLGSVVVRRSVVQFVGGLDPTLHAGEDWEWMLRIARRYPVGLVDKPVVLFRQRPLGDAGYVDESKEWQNLRASLVILHRHLRRDHFLRRLSMQRFVWKRRGWYASRFLQLAGQRMRAGERNQAMRCLYFGMRSSPVHTVLALCRSLRGSR